MTALATALAAASFAAAVAPARATTVPTRELVIGVRLTDRGVTFTRQKQAPRGSVVQFLITNVSRQRRWFTIGGHKTKLLRPRQREAFFLGFDRRGTVAYRSWGPGAAQYHGAFVVT